MYLIRTYVDTRKVTLYFIKSYEWKQLFSHKKK